MTGRIIVASLMMCLLGGWGFAQEDSLTLENGQELKGRLVGFTQSGFNFAVQHGSGIFLGQILPPANVANIVISSSEDQLFLLSLELVSDPVFKEDGIVAPERPVDVLQTTTNEEKRGRVEGYTDGILFFRTSDPREADAVDLIPIEEIESLTFSNADLDLQRKYDQLHQLAQSRYADEEALQQRLKRDRELRTLTAKIESERAKKVRGSIYQEMDMSQFYYGNTFSVSPGMILDMEVDPAMLETGTAPQPQRQEGYWDSGGTAPGSDETSSKDKARERLQERLDANRRRTRNLEEPTPRRSRSDSRSSSDRRSVGTRVGTSIPSIRSVERTYVGGKPVTIVNYE